MEVLDRGSQQTLLALAATRSNTKTLFERLNKVLTVLCGVSMAGSMHKAEPTSWMQLTPVVAPRWPKTSAVSAKKSTTVISKAQEREYEQFMRQNGSFLVKLVQQLLKTHLKTTAKDTTEQQEVVVGMDLATCLLQILWRFERIVRLGELVLENLLYQVAKKYIECTQQEAALKIFSCIHSRIWQYHQSLCTKLKETNKQQTPRSSAQSNKENHPNTTICRLPAPETFHSASLARLVLGFLSACCVLVLPFQESDSHLSDFVISATRWSQHLSRDPGTDHQLLVSLNGRMFRALWKCSTIVESMANSHRQNGKNLNRNPLSLRFAALSFMIKCPNCSSSYLIQQVYRSGMQFDRNPDKSNEESTNQLAVFYRDAKRLLHQTGKIDDLSRRFDHEYILWLDHMATINSKCHRRADTILTLAAAYHHTNQQQNHSSSINLVSWRIASSLLFALSLLNIKDGGDVNKSFRDSPLNSYLAQVNASLLQKIHRIFDHRNTQKQRMESTQALAHQVMENAAAQGNSEEIASSGASDKAGKSAMTFLLSACTRSSNTLFELIGQQRPVLSTAFLGFVMRSLLMATQCLKESRELTVNNEQRGLDEHTLGYEVKLRRISLIVSCRVVLTATDSAQLMNEFVESLQEQGEAMTSIEPIAKRNETIRQQMLPVLHSVIRELHSLGTKCYQRKQTVDAVSVLHTAFQFVKVTISLSSDVNRVCQVLKPETICSMVAQCYRDDEKIGMAREYVGWGLQYASVLDDSAAVRYLERYVGLIVEEASGLKGESRREELRRLSFKCCSFIKSLIAVLTTRDVPLQRIKGTLYCLRVLLDQTSQKLLCCLRNGDLKSNFEDRQSVSDCFRLLVHLESFVWNQLLSDSALNQMELAEETVKAITNRKLFYCQFFVKESASANDSGDFSKLVHLLSKALEKHATDTPSHALACAIGLKGVMLLEKLCMNSSTSNSPNEQLRKDDIEEVLTNITACLELLLALAKHQDQNPILIVEQFLVIITLESISSCMAFFQTQGLEESVRELLQKHQEQMRARQVPWIDTFASPMGSLLDFGANSCETKTNGMNIVANPNHDELSDVDRLLLQGIALRFSDSPEQTSVALQEAIKILQELRQVYCKPPIDAMVYKALGVRESIMHMVCSQVHSYLGETVAALEEAKQAFTLCVRLARQFARVCADESLANAERKLPETLQRFLEANDKQLTRAAPYFQAFEHTSWDILCCTSLALDQLAILQTQQGNPHKSLGYYGDCLQLVGMLGVNTFSKKLPFDMAQLLMQWGRTTQARELIVGFQADQVVCSQAAPSSLDETLHFERLCMLQGDLCMQERDYQQANKYYTESKRLLRSTLDRMKMSAWPQRAKQALAKCDRCIVTAYMAILRDWVDPDDHQWLREIIVHLNDLQVTAQDCADPVERLLGLCDLCRAWVVINKRFVGAANPVNGYKKAWMSMREIIQLLEPEFATCVRLGVLELEKSMRYTLGLALLSQCECFLADDMQVVHAWATAGLLMNASSIEPLISPLPKTDESKLSLSAKIEELCLRSQQQQSTTGGFSSVKSFAKYLQQQSSQLPSDWHVVSVIPGTSNKELVLTRLQSGSHPISFTVTGVEWAKWIKEMDDILIESRSSLSGHSVDETKSWSEKQKRGWWTKRSHLDERIRKLLKTLEAQLGFWKCFFIKSNPYKCCHQQDKDTRARFLAQCWSQFGQRNDAIQQLLCALLDAAQFLSDEELQDGLDFASRRMQRELPRGSIEELVNLLRINSRSPSQNQGDKPAAAAAAAAMEIESDTTSALLSLTKEEIGRMKVSELRRQLADHNLFSTGTRSELCDRLLEARDSALMQRLRQQEQVATSCNSASATPPNGDSSYPFTSTILILDARLSNLPWEGMQLLRSVAITRMPSLQLLLQNTQKLVVDRRCDGPIAGIDHERVAYVLNPGGDLGATQQKMDPVLQESANRFNWRGIVARIPTEQEIRDYLVQSDLFIYCGHGSGEKYFRRQQVETLGRDHGRCASAFLMGCSSGKLHHEGIFGPKAAVLSYLRAGSPSVVAMLWDVTDKDVDKMSVHLLQQWLLPPSKSGHGDDDKGVTREIPLGLALQFARDVCKLRFLNGCAAVCYGLPLYTKAGLHQ